MRHLFNEHEQWTSEAHALCDSIERAIRPLFVHAWRAGVSARDLQLIVNYVTMDLALEHVLTPPPPEGANP